LSNRLLFPITLRWIGRLLLLLIDSFFSFFVLSRILKQEKKYILDLIRDIKKTGCNVLLIQKSILRDAVNDLALHYLVCLLNFLCFLFSQFFLGTR
jgi:hypothetical protein